jgi:hypothetical protein
MCGLCGRGFPFDKDKGTAAYGASRPLPRVPAKVSCRPDSSHSTVTAATALHAPFASFADRRTSVSGGWTRAIPDLCRARLSPEPDLHAGGEDCGKAAEAVIRLAHRQAQAGNQQLAVLGGPKLTDARQHDRGNGAQSRDDLAGRRRERGTAPRSLDFLAIARRSFAAA